MPENPNQNNQNNNVNAYQYNPNRPQNTGGQNENLNEHRETGKVVDTAFKGASGAIAPGVGGAVYDMAKKTPGVGRAIDGATKKVAEVADQVPGVQGVSKRLNDSGLTDVVNQGMDQVGNQSVTSPSGSKTPNLKNGSKPSSAREKVGNPVLPLRKNTLFSSRSAQEEGLDQEDREENSNSGDSPVDDNSNESDFSDTSFSSPTIDDDTSANNNDSKDSSGDILTQGIKNIWKRHKLAIIMMGGGFIFLFLLLFILLGGGAGEILQSTGYVDTLCNYNDTKVTLTDCYQNSNDKEELATYDLQDFVIQMTYAYTKNGNYADEVIKAVMIALKTNTLSYGNYNSSDKDIEVRICDLYTNYDDENELDAFLGIDEDAEHLTSLYNEISNYLYISSSYQSTISTLSRQNALSFNESTLEVFQELEADGNTYSQILDAVYNTSEENTEDVVYRETLFLGDSRTRGMQNAGVINSGNTIYGVGYGYDWLIGNGTFSSSNTNSTTGGINGINNLMRDQANYNIVIWLGVNDLGNANLYYEEYANLARGEWSNHNIYIVSVGPVDSALSRYATNDAIASFNSTMQNLIASSGLNNLFYVDLGYTEDSILEYDSEGIHYSSLDYQNIYEIIVGHLDRTLNANYQLYNLTSYCTYYNLTENTAYWWPIGSSSATQGNIYGGDPTSTVVTSEFGRRNTGIAGASTNHKGIDIAKNGSACGDIVIASRSGTVIAVMDSDGARGTYVKIDHGDGVVTLYQHMREGSYTVELGEHVEQGQMIGLVGNTGVGSGCHLHFEVIVNGIEVDPLDYVDPDNPRPVSVNDIHVSLAGNSDDNQNMVCMTLRNSGFSVNAVAGMMVNLQAESGFSSINLQNSYESSLGYTDSTYTLAVDNGSYTNFVYDSAGYGLAQWTYYSRKQNLYNYARSRNTSIGDLGMQLEFFVSELQGYTDVYKYVTGNYEASDISTYFCLGYENPRNASTTCPTRTQAHLQEILTYVSNGCS